MRSMKLLFAATVLTTALLLAADVLDLCRVTAEGEIVFAPHVETDAFRRWGRRLGEALFPSGPAQADGREPASR